MLKIITLLKIENEKITQIKHQNINDNIKKEKPL